MTRQRKSTVRKPATKFMQLRKKMNQRKARAGKIPRKK